MRLWEVGTQERERWMMVEEESKSGLKGQEGEEGVKGVHRRLTLVRGQDLWERKESSL